MNLHIYFIDNLNIYRQSETVEMLQKIILNILYHTNRTNKVLQALV